MCDTYPAEERSMNIAIPVFGKRVSPRFDSAATFLLVRVNDGAVLESTERSMQDAYGWRRTELLTGDKVNVLLCGGIRQCDYYSVANAGIDVYPGLMGETQEVLEAFLRGEISKEGFCGGLLPIMARRRRREGGCRGNGQGSGRKRAGATKTPGPNRNRERNRNS
jgi:predicted Fe-Mo cluster-binding NifX family protein